MGRELETGALVIGSGIAGLSAAVALAEAGVDTLVLSAAPQITESNSVYAQGGIVYEGPSGDPESLVRDILDASSGTSYLPAVRQLAARGPELVRRVLFEKAQVPFDREGENFRLTREAAHAENRILHRGDESGRSIEEALVAFCRAQKNIRFLTHTTAVNLLMTSYHPRDQSRRHEENRCFGAFVFDQSASEVYPIFAQHTVIATGGIGQLYLHSTNSKFARGDGIALAERAGCRLENLEFIQFHPTTFYHPGSRRFLISEAVRGEGGILLNQKGERFMSQYLPAYPVPELASRDKVARAIHQEMLSTGAPCVYLDISHQSTEWIRERFPFIHRSCLPYGIDMTKQPIPVVPGAHYQCGGIWTDLQGRTSVPHLWAVGEVACTGLHGANRLASTSLLEGLVWGTAAGDEIGRKVGEGTRVAFPAIAPWTSETARVDPSFLSQDWLTLKHTMWNYVGLIKTEARLQRAEGILNELARGIDVFYRKAGLSDELIGLRHASHVALRILEACQRNPRSQGCYSREDLEI